MARYGTEEEHQSKLRFTLSVVAKISWMGALTILWISLVKLNWKHKVNFISPEANHNASKSLNRVMQLSHTNESLLVKVHFCTLFVHQSWILIILMQFLGLSSLINDNSFEILVYHQSHIWNSNAQLKSFFFIYIQHIILRICGLSNPPLFAEKVTIPQFLYLGLI